MGSGAFTASEIRTIGCAAGESKLSKGCPYYTAWSGEYETVMSTYRAHVARDHSGARRPFRPMPLGAAWRWVKGDQRRRRTAGLPEAPSVLGSAPTALVTHGANGSSEPLCKLQRQTLLHRHRMEPDPTPLRLRQECPIMDYWEIPNALSCDAIFL